MMCLFIARLGGDFFSSFLIKHEDSLYHLNTGCLNVTCYILSMGYRMARLDQDRTRVEINIIENCRFRLDNAF